MPVKVAVEGCCHGELNKIYAAVGNVDLLIICGDFQAIRNQTDLQTLNVPPKYLRMGDFHEYYLGAKKAPVLTIFIGGNHESLLYMRELQYGGWVAPNIYFLGDYGVVWYKGLRIAGMSGIWNQRTFSQFCRPQKTPQYVLPYNSSTIRSVYHVKPKNYLKTLMSGYSDIVVSHDWPQNVWNWGDKARLVKQKPYFKADMESGHLGSPAARVVLAHLKPRHWFSLHLHCRFTARVEHDNEIDIPAPRQKKVEEPKLSAEIDLDMDFEDTSERATDEHVGSLQTQQNDDEIDLDMDMEVASVKPIEEKVVAGADSKKGAGRNSNSSSPNPKKRKKDTTYTDFLALDKCLPKRRYLEVLLITPTSNHPSENSEHLHYDARCIATHKVLDSFISTNPELFYSFNSQKLLDLGKLRHLMEELDDAIVLEQRKMVSPDLIVPANFKKTAPDSNSHDSGPLKYWDNNQTKEFCQRFSLAEPEVDA